MPQSLVNALRSVEFGVPNVAVAERFYVDTWRLSVAARSERTVYLRGTSAFHHIVSLTQTDKPELLGITFCAATREDVDALAAKASAAGSTILRAPGPVDEPGGGYAVILRNPAGHVVRAVAGDARHADAAPQKDRPERLAHVVINSRDIPAGQAFYEGVMGFRLSDRTRIMAFMRCNNDHHNVALADADNDCLNHVAFVMGSLDDVMRGGGRMKDAGHPVQWGPGRHGPGNNLFNYFLGPFDFPIEYTAEVSTVDDNYRVGTPEDWKWPPGRIDHWGIGTMPTPELKAAQKRIAFAPEWRL
jgi:catechol 2,3-dioxygenase